MTNCHALKIIAKDGKSRLSDVKTKDLLRLIQSIPSKKAEPFLFCKGTKKNILRTIGCL